MYNYHFSMNLEALLHTYFIQQQQTAFPTLFIKWIFFHVNVTDGNNGRFVYVFSVAIHAACKHLSRPKQPPTLRSDLWQLLGWAISLFPYYSHQVLLKTETSGLNITLTEEKQLSIDWRDSQDLRHKEGKPKIEDGNSQKGSKRTEQKT